MKEHATKITNYEKKEMIPLTCKENKTNKKQKVCYICNKGFSTDYDNKKYHKLEIYSGGSWRSLALNQLL